MVSTELQLREHSHESFACRDTPLVETDTLDKHSACGRCTGNLLTAMSIIFCMCSYVSLINLTKVVMSEGYFPHSVALTWFDQLVTFLLGSCLYASFGKMLFPTLGPVMEQHKVLFIRILPLAFFFAAYVTCAIEANVHSTVAFIQMCKQLNPALVYAVMRCCRLEKSDWIVMVMLLVIISGSSFAIKGEIEFSATGFIFQLSAQSCKTFYLVIQQTLMQDNLKLDALSTVLVISPFSLFFLSGCMFAVWTPEILENGRKHWLLVVLHAVTAFFVDVAVTTVVKQASALTYMVVNALNSIVVVVVASILFGSTMTVRQAVGYGISIIGIVVYSSHRAKQAASNRNSEVASPSSICLTRDAETNPDSA